MTALGTLALGVGALAGTWTRNPPTVTVTSPIGSVATETATVTWSYSSTVPRAQSHYQVQYRSTDDVTVLYDSSVQAGAGTSLAVPYLLSSGSNYRVWVRAYDGSDWSDWATASFLADLPGVADYPDETAVGSIYEIAINGTGYMLADTPERPYDRQVGVLDPPRFATGSTPFNEAIERYNFVGQVDWTGGAGQDRLDRPRSDEARFDESEGVNPFEDGKLQLLPASETELADAYATPLAVVASEILFITTADGELSAIDDPGDTPTVFSITGAAAPLDMTSDGTYWYYADGANVFRNSSAADPGTAWSTLNAYLVEWCSDRIAVAYTNGSSEAVLSTLAPDATEEVASGRFQFNPGSTIKAITAGDGYIWFAVERSGISSIFAWKLGSDESYFTALTLPAGQKVTALGFYLGNVLVRATEPGTTKAYIYRAVPAEGRLTAEVIVELDDTGVDHGTGAFGGDDRYVLFSWKAMTSGGRSGLGAIDLSTGGWVKWIYADSDSATGNVLSIVQWEGRTAFTVAGYGTVLEGTTPLSSGWLKTSISDLGSALTKALDEIKVILDPLPSGGSVALEYTLDEGSSFTSAGTSASTAGTKSASWDVVTQAPSIGLKVTLGASATSPVVRATQIKLHALPISDQILVVPINGARELTGLNGQVLPPAPSGQARARVLESLAGSRVRLQDVDWPVTQTASIWEVVGVRTVSVGTWNQRLGRREESPVVTLTLRRSLS
jgi:hypothetical protein